MNSSIGFVQLNFLNYSVTHSHPCLPRTNDLLKEGRSGQLSLVFTWKCKIQRKEEKTHWSVDLPDSLPEKVTLKYKFAHLSYQTIPLEENLLFKLDVNSEIQGVFAERGRSGIDGQPLEWLWSCPPVPLSAQRLGELVLPCSSDSVGHYILPVPALTPNTLGQGDSPIRHCAPCLLLPTGTKSRSQHQQWWKKPKVTKPSYLRRSTFGSGQSKSKDILFSCYFPFLWCSQCCFHPIYAYRRLQLQ